MAEAIAERVRRYILDGSDEDLRRLLGVAETTREMARSAFRRVGMREGWHAIDCGCGPIGGLAVMAEMAGPAGRVVGVDFSEPAIQRARSVVAALGLGNVKLFAGDIHELGAAAVGGPFDLAYTRLFPDAPARPGTDPQPDRAPASPRRLGRGARGAAQPAPAVPPPPRCSWRLLGSGVRPGGTGRGCAARRRRWSCGVGARGGPGSCCGRHGCRTPRGIRRHRDLPRLPGPPAVPGPVLAALERQPARDLGRPAPRRTCRASSADLACTGCAVQGVDVISSRRMRHCLPNPQARDLRLPARLLIGSLY